MRWIYIGLSIYALQRVFAGEYAITANTDSGTVSVIDITDPHQLVVVGIASAGPNHHPHGIAITPDRNFVVTANEIDNTCSVIDVSNPAKPIFVADVFIGAGAKPSNVAITPDGNFAVVTNQDGDNISIIDFTVRSQPKVVGSTLSDPGHFSGPESVAITPNGQYAAVALTSSGAVAMINITDVKNPTITDIEPLYAPGDAPFTVRPYSIAVTADGQYAITVNETSGTLMTIKITDPMNLQIKGTAFLGENALKDPRIVGITPDQRYTLNTNFSDNNISIMDINNPSAPVLQGTSTALPHNTPYGLAITPDGKYAVVTYQTYDYLTMIDIQNLASPQVISSIYVEGESPLAVVITPFHKQSPLEISTGTEPNANLLQKLFVNTLMWKAPSGFTPTSYRIERTWTYKGQWDSATFHIKGDQTWFEDSYRLYPRTTYNYKVTAIETSGALLEIGTGEITLPKKPKN